MALCLVVYLPGFFSLPPVDRDESRFAQASRQMFESVALPPSMRDPALHSGGLVIPKVQGRNRLNKPPLIYWLQAASAAVFTAGRPLSDSIWMYRVPSLLGAIAAVLLTWRLGTSLFDSRTGRLAAALLACCPVVAWEARQARADMVLLALNTAAMLALWRMWEAGRDGETRHGGQAPRRRDEVGRGRARWMWAMVFWVSLALAILTKGPITPLVAGLSVLALCVVSRRWRWLLDLRPLTGVLIVAVVVGPWVYLVGERVGWSAYLKTVMDETLGRVASSREGHWGPPGYHTLLLALLFWPGSLMTAAGIVLAFRQGLKRADATPGTPVPRSTGWLARLRSLYAGHSPYLFCLCWIIPAWIVFELVSTKLPHYTLPMYPAIALLSARAVLAADAGLLRIGTTRATRAGVNAWAVVGLVLAVAIPGAFMLVAVVRSSWPVFAGVAAVVLAAASLWQVRQATHAIAAGRALRGQFRGILAFGFTIVGSIGLLAPSTDDLWVSSALAPLIDAADPRRERAWGAVGYHEDSLLFVTRGKIERLPDEGVAEWSARHPRHLLVIPESSVLRSHVVVGRAEGFNYSRGRWERLAVVHHFRDGREPPP